MNSKLPNLCWIAALWNALAGRDLDYFPRVEKHGSTRSMPTGELIRELSQALDIVDADTRPEDRDRIVKLTRESLNEVKLLTEYQDSKATRLLTILTFLSALAAVLFGRLLDMFPVAKMQERFTWARPSDLWVWASYAAFAVFVLLAVGGALVTFHAIRTRFKYSISKAGTEPRSLIFYQGMLASGPEKWVDAFCAGGRRTVQDPSPTYIKNYIMESYLVAAKAADKLRYLEVAQSLQAASIKFLLAFFLMSAVAVICAQPVTTPDPTVGLISQMNHLASSLDQINRSLTNSDSAASSKSEPVTPKDTNH